MRRGRDIKFIEIDGLTIRVLARNVENGQVPLLILNGLGQSIEILAPFMQEMGERPLIVFDMPGLGRSQASANSMTIPQYAVLTSALLRRLGVENYDVLGISWGGSVAQQLAHDQPGNCRKLILAVSSAGGLVSWWGNPVALSEIMLPLRLSDKTYSDLVGPLMYGGEALIQPELFREYSRYALRPTLQGYYTQVRAMCSWTSICWLHRIRQPTLVIAGIYDALIPFPNQLLLAHAIPSAELEVYPAGHLLVFSRRQEVGHLVGEFLDRDHGNRQPRRRKAVLP